ncbi:MAG: inositol-3-phosphate synthase [Candidatus Paceibacterota bacterium]
MEKIKIAIVGVGNCASSLVQGIEFYKDLNNKNGLINETIGGYRVSDIEVVAAFDVDKRKVGKDLSEAIFSEPNCTKKFSDIPHKDVVVNKGNVLDGISNTMGEYFLIDDNQETSNIVEILKNSKAEMVVCYLPVGSAKAARFYAESALEAGVGFINAIPEFICSDKAWIDKFKEKGLPCAGDDIKSQVGATILHRIITRLMQDRGFKIDNTYQLNIGGNTDFRNMLNKSRLESKRISKTQAVVSNLDEGEKISTRIGPSDFVSHLKDNKICYINVKGTQFGDVPFELDLKLSVEDSPNSAGCIVDVVRYMKLALNKGISGNLEEVSAYYFKSPLVQIREDEVKNKLKNLK